MKIALVEPYIRDESLGSFAEKNEPVHLVGMYNQLADHGFDVHIIDAFSNKLSAQDLTASLQDNEVTHAGFSTYDYAPCISYLQNVFNAIRGEIAIIVGGSGPTHTSQRMADILEPDWIVQGMGEKCMLELCKSNFSPQNVNASRLEKSWVVSAENISLDEIPHQRPYSLESYGFEASLRVQKGCSGNCVFCLGGSQKEYDYISRDKADQLIRYVVQEKDAQILSPCGPDFNSNPKKANDVIASILENAPKIKAFRPGVRLDTLYLSMQQDPSLWKELGEQTSIRLESSIETFSPDRMRRLGKNIHQQFLHDIFDHMEDILETCPSLIVLGRIALDPTIQLEEFILDCHQFISLLSLFPDRITIGGSIMNKFVPLWGTPSMDPSLKDNPWAEPDIFIDDRVQRLKSDLLDLPKFKRWCKLAENVNDFQERNEVICEILRVAGRYAKRLEN